MVYNIDVIKKILDDNCVNYKEIGSVIGYDEMVKYTMFDSNVNTSDIIVTYLSKPINDGIYGQLGDFIQYNINENVYMHESRKLKLKHIINGN